MLVVRRIQIGEVGRRARACELSRERLRVERGYPIFLVIVVSLGRGEAQIGQDSVKRGSGCTAPATVKSLENAARVADVAGSVKERREHVGSLEVRNTAIP